MYFVEENLTLPKTEKSSKQDNKKTDRDHIFKEGEQNKDKKIKLTVDTDRLVFALESDVYDSKKVNDVVNMLRNKVKTSDKKEIQRIFSEDVKNFSIKEFKKFISEMCFYPISEHVSKEVFFEITKVIAEHVYINYMEYNDFFASEELVFGIRVEWFVEFMKTNLNFQDKKKTVQTYMYLRLVNIVDGYADLEQVMLLEEWKERTESLFNYIHEQKDNPEISYFLHLYANDVYSEHANMRTETWFEELNRESDEYEAKMNEKYGNSWGKLEERIEELQENIVASRQEPFLIAPKIYAIPGYNGFYISQEEDFEVIQKLIDDLKKLPHSFYNFLSTYDREGNYGLDLRRHDKFYSKGRDDKEYIRQEIHDLFYDKMMQLLKYFIKSLNISDVSANKNIEESVFNEYIILQVSDIKEIIQKEFSFNFSDLHLREQFYFIKFTKEVTLADADKIKKFVKVATDKNARINRIKTFLSLEQGGLEMGEKILKIGERFKKDEAGIAQNIFDKYAELVDTVYDIEDYLKEQFGKDNSELIQKIQEELLMAGKAILVMFADEEMTAEAARQRLTEINIQTSRISTTIRNLSSEDIANLNLKNIEDVELDIISKPQELLEDKNQELLQQMLSLIESKFPGDNEKEKFKKELLDSTTTRIIISKIGKEILSFFTKKRTDDGRYIFDWMTSNDKNVVRGLGEATIVSGFNESHREGQEYYTVAKPYVKTFRILIEKLGFVAYEGITADGEYFHHYAKTRRLKNDINYTSKIFSPEQDKEFAEKVKQELKTPNELQEVEFAGNTYKVAKIVFENTKYSQDATKNDSDGFIYRLIEEQYKNRRVLTRFIPDSYEKENKTFYAVFE